MPWPYGKILKPAPFSEEDVCIVSKEDPCQVMKLTKILFSGSPLSGTGQASGYQFWSGESDVEPISHSGWGNIRVPELNQLHGLFVFPTDPCVEARVEWYEDTLIHNITSGYPTGTGGCSGKVALVHYVNRYANTSGISSCSFASGTYTSGIIQLIAFGSKY